jgi:hypothetical protein
VINNRWLLALIPARSGSKRLAHNLITTNIVYIGRRRLFFKEWIKLPSYIELEIEDIKYISTQFKKCTDDVLFG